jgi:hypothetical protein
MRTAQVTTGTIISTTRASRRRTGTVDTKASAMPRDFSGNQRIARPRRRDALTFLFDAVKSGAALRRVFGGDSYRSIIDRVPILVALRLARLS